MKVVRLACTHAQCMQFVVVVVVVVVHVPVTFLPGATSTLFRLFFRKLLVLIRSLVLVDYGNALLLRSGQCL